MYEELDVNDDSFEVSHNAVGANVMYVPIMEEYPSPTNQFDVFLGANGGESGQTSHSGSSDHFQPSGTGTSPTGTSGGSKGIDPDAIAGTVDTFATMFSKTEEQKALKTRCGRRPLLAKKRASSGWDACKEQFYAERGSYGSGRDDQYRYQDYPTKTGLSTGAKIGIGVLIAGAVGTAIYFAVKGAKAKAK